MAGGRKATGKVRWKPSRTVRNFLALHSLRWRAVKPDTDYDDFDVEVYRGKTRIAHLQTKWKDQTIMFEIEWGLEHNNGS